MYNIGGGHELKNVDLTHRILEILDRPQSLIQPVEDRLGHDRRYSLDTSKLRALGWAPRASFDDGLMAVAEWYRTNEWWWRPIKDGDTAFRSYYQQQYGERGQRR